MPHQPLIHASLSDIEIDFTPGWYPSIEYLPSQQDGEDGGLSIVLPSLVPPNCLPAPMASQLTDKPMLYFCEGYDNAAETPVNFTTSPPAMESPRLVACEGKRGTPTPGQVQLSVKHLILGQDDESFAFQADVIIYTANHYVPNEISFENPAAAPVPVAIIYIDEGRTLTTEALLTTKINGTSQLRFITDALPALARKKCEETPVLFMTPLDVQSKRIFFACTPSDACPGLLHSIGARKNQDGDAVMVIGKVRNTNCINLCSGKKTFLLDWGAAVITGDAHATPYAAPADDSSAAEGTDESDDVDDHQIQAALDSFNVALENAETPEQVFNALYMLASIGLIDHPIIFGFWAIVSLNLDNSDMVSKRVHVCYR